MSAETSNDGRTPSPPFGYSRTCELSHEEQVRVVAQFHAHQIRPNRIAYRMGIDIALIEGLIAGEIEGERFPAMVQQFRQQRYRDRMRATASQRAGSRYDLQQQIEKEHQLENNTAGPGSAR